MAVTWKKVLGSGQVVSADLASEGNSGEVLTTDGSGSLSYTAKTVNTDTNTNQLTTWILNGGTASTINQGETVIISGSGGTAVTSGGTDNRTITVTSTAIACPNTSASPTFSGLVTSATLTVSGQVYMSNVDANQGDDLTLNTDYQSDDYVKINGVDFTGGGDISAGDITCSGDLTVSGDTITQNVSEILVEDDAITMLHNVGNDTTDGAIVFTTSTAGNIRAVGHDASANRIVIAESITDGVLGNIHGMVSTIETHATAEPTSSNLGSGVGSFWVEEDTNYLYVRVE